MNGEDRQAFIDAEIKRMKGLCEDIPTERREMTEPLIERIAFTLATLTELEANIQQTGMIVSYDIGDNQKGTATNPAIKMHNSTMSVYLKALKQLTDILYRGLSTEDKETKLQAFLREAN